ncbi:MAG: hypothetical protein K5785_01030 [Nitrosarchaeum sp.]|nr:hypothetical protein [Nitrosarchaeum sp.]
MFTEEQKSIIIGYADKCVAELQSSISKITNRKEQFIASNGNTEKMMEKDLTKLTMKELKTKAIVLNKFRSELTNTGSWVLFELEKVDKEIVRRQ